MLFNVQVKIMPHTNLLDPQGKAVLGGLNNLGLAGVQDVRVGKHVQLQVDAADAATAKTIATEAASKLLANQVMEFFEVEVL
jgi:phosphoribosylformylglycinamidine synthase subunit PurS